MCKRRVAPEFSHRKCERPPYKAFSSRNSMEPPEEGRWGLLGQVCCRGDQDPGLPTQGISYNVF